MLKSSKPVIDRLDQVITKQDVQIISTFNCSTLYIKLPHKDLVKVLFVLINLGFNGGSMNEKENIFP